MKQNTKKRLGHWGRRAGKIRGSKEDEDQLRTVLSFLSNELPQLHREFL